MIPYGKQEITQQDIDAVVNVLKSDFLTQGPKVPEFEKALCDYTGVTHAVAVNSATSALHIACLSLGLGQGDWLWTSSITFVASANCGLYCGARVDFVDIDPNTYNLCPNSLRRKLEIAKFEGCLPKVLVAVHLCGQPCDMKAIRSLADEYQFNVIEDASHAIGGMYFDEPVGNCRYSDITVFSFHPVKIITTAEGGAALTNSDKLAKKMDLYRSHGVTRDPKLITEPMHGPWYYQQIELGFNYRMPDLNAALGISQIQRLDELVLRRHQISGQYNELLSGLPVVLPHHLEGTYSALHLYVIRLKLNEVKSPHRQVFESLRNEGIGVNLHYIPVHTQPYYRQFCFNDDDFPETMHYYKEAISLPIYPGLTQKQIFEIVDKVRECVSDLGNLT